MERNNIKEHLNQFLEDEKLNKEEVDDFMDFLSDETKAQSGGEVEQNIKTINKRLFDKIHPFYYDIKGINDSTISQKERFEMRQKQTEIFNIKNFYLKKYLPDYFYLSYHLDLSDYLYILDHFDLLDH